jgi:hypothetical protein
MNTKFGAALSETLKECYKLSPEVFLTTKQENLISNILATKLNTCKALIPSLGTKNAPNPFYVTEKSLSGKRVDMVHFNSKTKVDEIFEAKYLWSDDFGYNYWAIKEVCQVLHQLNTHNNLPKKNTKEITLTNDCKSYIIFYYVLFNKAQAAKVHACLTNKNCTIKPCYCNNTAPLKGLKNKTKSYTYLHAGRKGAFNDDLKISFTKDEVYHSASICEIKRYKEEVCNIVNTCYDIQHNNIGQHSYKKKPTTIKEYINNINIFKKETKGKHTCISPKMNFGSKSVVDSLSYVMDGFKTKAITGWLPQIEFSLGITIFELGKGNTKNSPKHKTFKVIRESKEQTEAEKNEKIVIFKTEPPFTN